MTGIVFSIEEFSTFDGPGIRTTVFLKGCPMRCAWCHNPEGQLPEPQMLRSPNGCLGCGKCLDEGERITGKRVLVKESAGVCPRNLVRECGTEYEPFELVKKLLKNADILTESGGGATFSGGEPLFQQTFLKECLSLLEGKLHRAVQTSGYCEPKAFAEILGCTDLFLFDLKIADAEAHRHYTGCGNEYIKENFSKLTSFGTPYIVRIPLIPGVTDTEDNITALCRFMKENGTDYAELLPYNKMAGGKYPLAGRKYLPGFDVAVEPQPRTDIFSGFGIKTRVM